VNLITLEPAPDALPRSLVEFPSGPVIEQSEPAPLVTPAEPGTPQDHPAAEPTAIGPGLLAQWLNPLLGLLAATPLRSIDDLVAAARIVALAVVAGIALRLTGATLGAIEEIPLLGGLLELVGLVSLWQFLARNALRQQKRAELLERIRQLRRQLLS
jgi:hypothetical protein